MEIKRSLKDRGFGYKKAMEYPESTNKCKHCQSNEITYNSVVMDEYYSDCGSWQDDE